MPSCFSLTRKGEKERMDFVKVDEEMRHHFGAPGDREHWYKNWYATIGLCLAMGHRWDRLREVWTEKVDVINWLEEHFEVDNWKEWK